MRCRRSLAFWSAGRKRRKSTCSPICVISARITADAAPNFATSNGANVPGSAVRPAFNPANATQMSIFCQSDQRDGDEGQDVEDDPDRLRQQLEPQLISFTPCVTSGITTTALMM